MKIHQTLFALILIFILLIQPISFVDVGQSSLINKQKTIKYPIKLHKNDHNIDCDIIVPDDYPTIKEALTHAFEYCTIFVRSGIYEETLEIKINALQLIGEDLNNTIIRGNKEDVVISIYGFLSIITGFTIENGYMGISITNGTPTYNTIYGNLIQRNTIGIAIENAPRSNCIYHNNFIANDNHAFDSTVSNSWYYDKEIQRGNYWDDYTGYDTNNDGIGDVAYSISGGENKDKYPLMLPYKYYPPPQQPEKPTGPQHGKAQTNYTYMVSTVDPNQEKIYYWFDWGDSTNSTWIGPHPSGTTCETQHIWQEKGNYTIRVKAKNEQGAVSMWSLPLSMQIPKNQLTQNILLRYLYHKFTQIQDEKMIKND